MFERFSEQARRVLFHSRAEASRLGTRQIAPEHFLLGILREGHGAAYELLFDRLSLDPQKLLQDVEARMEKKPPFEASIEIPFTKTAKEVLTVAVEEADRLQDKVIGPEHLLIGILRSDSAAAAVLMQHGVTLELARQKP